MGELPVDGDLLLGGQQGVEQQRLRRAKADAVALGLAQVGQGAELGQPLLREAAPASRRPAARTFWPWRSASSSSGSLTVMPSKSHVPSRSNQSMPDVTLSRHWPALRISCPSASTIQPAWTSAWHQLGEVAVAGSTASCSREPEASAGRTPRSARKREQLAFLVAVADQDPLLVGVDHARATVPGRGPPCRRTGTRRPRRAGWGRTARANGRPAGPAAAGELPRSGGSAGRLVSGSDGNCHRLPSNSQRSW